MVTGLVARLKQALDSGDATAAEALRKEVVERYGKIPEFRVWFEQLGLIPPIANDLVNPAPPATTPANPPGAGESGRL
jgi:hypothetical protein